MVNFEVLDCAAEVVSWDDFLDKLGIIILNERLVIPSEA